MLVHDGSTDLLIAMFPDAYLVAYLQLCQSPLSSCYNIRCWSRDRKIMAVAEKELQLVFRRLGSFIQCRELIPQQGG